jgi:hypothetical protein
MPARLIGFVNPDSGNLARSREVQTTVPTGQSGQGATAAFLPGEHARAVGAAMTNREHGGYNDCLTGCHETEG